MSAERFTSPLARRRFKIYSCPRAQCSCRGVPAMSVVCAKQSLWYAEITNSCDMLNGMATMWNNIRRKQKQIPLLVAFCPGLGLPLCQF